MEITLRVLIAIFIMHFIGDFVLQTNWMARNKSRSANALMSHVGVYTLVLFVGLLLVSHFSLSVTMIAWVLLNGSLHAITDAITSRATSALWRSGDVHNFFVVVGVDQLIHYITLIITSALL